MHLMPVGSDCICIVVVIIILILSLFMQEIPAQQTQAMPRCQLPHSAHQLRMTEPLVQRLAGALACSPHPKSPERRARRACLLL